MFSQRRQETTISRRDTFAFAHNTRFDIASRSALPRFKKQTPGKSIKHRHTTFSSRTWMHPQHAQHMLNKNETQTNPSCSWMRCFTAATLATRLAGFWIFKLLSAKTIDAAELWEIVL